MADLTKIEDFILKRLLGEISMEENAELTAWADESPANKAFLEVRMSPAAFQQKLNALQELDYDRIDQLMAKYMGADETIKSLPSSRRNRVVIWTSVAALLISVIAGIWWFSRPREPQTITQVHKLHAILSWATGSIVLEDMQDGKGYLAGAIQIARLGNQFFIHPWPAAKEANANSNSTNYTIAVSGKEVIQLFFNDSIRTQAYPGSSANFTIPPPGAVVKERTIACNGQFLFDVNHNSHLPFTVITPKQKIHVLGTVFQVRDYSKEDTGAVFCYAGKVLVNNLDDSAKTLEASQRVTVTNHHGLEVSSGDFPTVQFSSPELLFDFTELSLDSAMNEISQWYGISKIKYLDRIDRKTQGTVFTGKVSRYLTLYQLLTILQRADLHFTVQDQTILVRK